MLQCKKIKHTLQLHSVVDKDENSINNKQNKIFGIINFYFHYTFLTFVNNVFSSI